ncbi:MAG: MopE-related protein, partial [Myxococcota bacterium]
MRRLCPLVLLAACTGTVDVDPTDSDSDVAPCDDPVAFYVDDDYDGYGVTSTRIESCRDPGDGFATRDGDCDDLDDDTFPGAIEGCDGRDRDCDGQVDNDVVDAPEWRPDADGDGFADARPTSGVKQCEAPAGYTHSTTAFDCDDTSPLAYPGADDPPCDGIDQDC